MNNALKLIIPLMNENFKLDDFKSENGFVEAYLEDINRPSLVNHIFLLYDGVLSTSKMMERDERFRSFGSLYSRKTIYISGNPYLIYTFVTLSKDILDIKEGRIPYKNELLKKIMHFWTIEDDFMFEIACDRNTRFEVEGLIVPEEDYIPEPTDEFDNEPLL